MSKSIVSVIFLLFALVTLTAQDRFASVEIKEHKLTDNIYMLEGSGGNIGLLVGENEVLMIDDQYAPLSEKIMAKVKSLSSGSVTKLINTHWHGDHSGGNENFAKGGAMIFAHDNVYKRMSTEQKRGDRVTPASPDKALPVVTYSSSMNLYMLDEPVLVIHAHNAHTDGDSFVFLPESNVIHMGDCFFHQRFPYIDVDSGGSIDGMIETSEAALMIVDDETQIIPGHGPMATKADLTKYHMFLKTIKERVQSFVANGRGMESIDTEKIVEGYADWAWGFIDAERMTNIVYNSLTQGQ